MATIGIMSYDTWAEIEQRLDDRAVDAEERRHDAENDLEEALDSLKAAREWVRRAQATLDRRTAKAKDAATRLDDHRAIEPVEVDDEDDEEGGNA